MVSTPRSLRPFSIVIPYLSDRVCEKSSADTVQVTKVSEPSGYGVVVTKPGTTIIDRFVEKPSEFVGNRINAGIYMFNPSILNRIQVGDHCYNIVWPPVCS